MSTAKSVASWAMRRSGCAWAVRHAVAKHRVSILVYHDPSRETVARHIEYLKPRYHGVELSRVIDAMAMDRWDSLPNYSLVITFDDGWSGNRDAATLFVQAGFPATIFACTQIVGTHRHYWWTETENPDVLKCLLTEQRLAALVGRGFALDREYSEGQALTDEDMRAMADFVDFGAHTRFHPILTVCSDEEAWEEIEVSRREAEALLGRECRHFAYPNGDYAEREVEMARRAGFASARTVDVGWTNSTTDPHRLPALPTVDDGSVNRLAADLSGAGFLWRRKWTGKWDGRHPTTVPSTLGFDPGSTTLHDAIGSGSPAAQTNATRGGRVKPWLLRSRRLGRNRYGATRPARHSQKSA